MTGEGEKQRYDQNLDREIREMISALTRRLGDLQKQPGEKLGVDDNAHDDHGVRIITMAGTNMGAMMRGEIADLEKASGTNYLKQDQEADNTNPENDVAPPPLTTYLNSNFQAINNSIMFGGSYSTNDPGIHLDVSDYYNPTHGADHKAKHPKKAKRKAAAESSSKSDHHSD